MPNVIDRYEARLAERGYTADPAQRAARLRMASGMAPCPGKTTRAARWMTAGSAVISMRVFGLTWASAALAVFW